MPKKRTYVVRVARDHRDFENPFVECLRYAGHVRVHDESELVFDIMPPSGLDSKVWATQLAGKMESFGYNAVVAPEWKE